MRLNKPQLTTVLWQWGLGLLLFINMATSQADTSVGRFSVIVNLTSPGTGLNTAAQSPPGVCISETLSELTNAVVRVVCGTKQFVSITANPNARFLGTHGGAFRFVLNPAYATAGPQSSGQGRADEFYPGTGTVTALRIYNVDGSEAPLEVLLTF